MQALLTTQPGLGHLHPLVPLAHALQRAGHQVTFACAGSFIPYVEGCGLRALPAGPDWLESEADKMFPDVRGMSPAEQEAFLGLAFVETIGNDMVHDVFKICQDWRPDLVVRDEFEYGGCVAAECLGLPHAAVGLELFISDQILKWSIESPLARLRHANGLPPQPAMEMLNRYLYLSHMPARYHFPGQPLPPTAHVLRYVPFMQSGDETLPVWVNRLANQPTVYVSLGTVFNRMPEIFKMILDGLAGEAINLILTVGRNQDPSQFGPVPENVHVERYIPQDALMPYCDVAITGGGVGATLTALSQGVPVVIIPTMSFGMLHALRCQALGVGNILLPPWWSEGDFGNLLATLIVGTSSLFPERPPLLSPETICAAVRMLLETEYRQAAQRLRMEIESLPAPEHAVELLERLAVEHTPLVARKN
jgi:UDP:flavonoid glycosyltransferase YjiC (YdhE family)